MAIIRKLSSSSTLIFSCCYSSHYLRSPCVAASSLSPPFFPSWVIRRRGHHPNNRPLGRAPSRSPPLVSSFSSSLFLIETPFVSSNQRRRTFPRFATLSSSSSSSSTAEPIVVMTEIRSFERSITCSDGVRLAMKCWRNFDFDRREKEDGDGVGDGDGDAPTIQSYRKILCLHGWLDNAASFDRFAPLLLRSLSSDDDNKDDSFSSAATEIIALDFPGHGLSGHKSPDGPPQLLAEYAYYVVELFDALHWGSPFDESPSPGTPSAPRDKVTVIGHSMGAGVAVVLAASFPEWCASLVLLEGAGPLARNADDAPRHVRAACRRRIRSNRLLFPKENDEGRTASSSSSSRAKIYESVDAAIEARLDTARRMPGDQYLSVEAARDMVLRATVPATDPPDTSPSSSSSSDRTAPVTFRHDPRLQWPSLQYYTREQVESFYRHAARPVCLLSAEDGWPVDGRSEEAVREVLRPEYQKRLKGSHHFHADPDTVEEVVEHVTIFLRERGL